MPTREQIKAEINEIRLSVGEEAIAITEKLSGLKAIAAGIGLIIGIGGLVTACVTTAGLGCAFAILALIASALILIDEYLADDDERDELERKRNRLDELNAQLVET